MNEPASVETWVERIQEALDKGASPEPLAVAQEALRDHPADAGIVHFAALGALVADKPDLCLRYLKRLGKRYQPLPCDHLLRALVLIRQGLADQGRQVLERHGLDRRQEVTRHFRGGPALTYWMLQLWSGAYWAVPPPRTARQAKAPAPKAKGRAAPRPPVSPPVAQAPVAPELPRVQPRIAVE
ncbi:MAG: hypothetical protein U1E26_11700, partial [Coriobacteriia bacterium]|nr:hypothetical protein [Coriobacteriia bacterium]